MIRSMKKVARVLLAVAVLSGGMLSGAAGVWAKEKGTTLAKQIQGSWTLVSIYNEQDGKKIEPFGAKPRGSLIFTPDGRFSIFCLRASLPKFAANNRMKGTAEENQAIVQGSHRRLWHLCGGEREGANRESAHRGEHLPQLGWPGSETGHDRQRRRTEGHQPHRDNRRGCLCHLETGQVAEARGDGVEEHAFFFPLAARFLTHTC